MLVHIHAHLRKLPGGSNSEEIEGNAEGMSRSSRENSK